MRRYLDVEKNLTISTVKELMLLSSSLNSVIQAIARESGILQRQKRTEIPPLTWVITDAVKNAFGVDFRVKSRRKDIVMARHAATHLLKKHLDLSLSMIAEATGNTHHTTTMSSLKQAQKLLRTNIIFRERVKSAEIEIIKMCVAA